MVRAAGACSVATGLLAGLLALGGPAGAHPGFPGEATATNGLVSYEADCTSTGLASSTGTQVTDFIVSTTINTTKTRANLSNGTAFGVTGSVKVNYPAEFLAGVAQGLYTALTELPAKLGSTLKVTFGSTDGHLAGTYRYAARIASTTFPGGALKTVTYAAATATLKGTFGTVAGKAPAVGDVVYGKGISTSPVAKVTATASTHITITPAPSAAGTKVAISWVTAAGLTLTATTIKSGAAFHTNGTGSTTAGIGIVAVTQVYVTTTPVGSFQFGGTAGKAPATKLTGYCLETGWTSTGTAGPAQTNMKTVTAPLAPKGTTTPLVKGGTPPEFEPGAYVTLVATGSAPAITTTTLPAGKATHHYTFTLQGSGGVRPYTWSTTSALPAGLSLSSTGVISGFPEAAFTGTVAVTLTTSTKATATATLKLKVTATTVKKVHQELQATLTPGSLLLSCQPIPLTSITDTSPTVVKGCAPISFGAVTLSESQESTTAKMNPIYVSTARGSETSGWEITAVMIPTATNTHTDCSTVQGFCNSTGKATKVEGQIQPTTFTLSGWICGKAPTVTNAVPSYTPASVTLKTPRPLCKATAAKSGGRYTVKTGTFTLKVPGNIHAGKYVGTVQYTVMGT